MTKQVIFLFVAYFCFSSLCLSADLTSDSGHSEDSRGNMSSPFTSYKNYGDNVAYDFLSTNQSVNLPLSGSGSGSAEIISVIKNLQSNVKTIRFETSLADDMSPNFWDFIKETISIDEKFLTLPWLNNYKNEASKLFENFEQLEKTLLSKEWWDNYSEENFDIALCNPTLNRYKNAMPFNFNRCSFRGKYINASQINADEVIPLIVGEKRTKLNFSVIAAQAPIVSEVYKESKEAKLNESKPKEDTWQDFFHLIWEKQTSIITNLTDFKEEYRYTDKPSEVKHKSEQYWPNFKESKNTDDLFIENVGEMKVIIDGLDGKIRDNHTIIALRLKNLHSNENRIVFLIRYIGWPDAVIPPTDLADDLLIINRIMDRCAFINEKLDGPELIHCSAGLRRTGAFIAIRIAIRHVIMSGKPPDLVAIIKIMQTMRFGLVGYAKYCRVVYETLVKYLNSAKID